MSGLASSSPLAPKPSSAPMRALVASACSKGMSRVPMSDSVMRLPPMSRMRTKWGTPSTWISRLVTDAPTSTSSSPCPVPNSSAGARLRSRAKAARSNPTASSLARRTTSRTLSTICRCAATSSSRVNDWPLSAS